MFTLRELATIQEFHDAEDIQRKIWNILDDTEVVPLHILLTAQKNGGLAVGAFDASGAMIGFLFGFLGRARDGRWKHCSHMMGIIPGYRRGGVGDALKRYQREFALRQGLDLVTWTFDPMEGVNATLNFGKLGVVCGKYERDLYGSMADELNQGLPSDRFEVEWWIASPRVVERLTPETARVRLEEVERAGVKDPRSGTEGTQRVNRTEVRGGLRLPRDADLDLTAPRVLVEVPADFQAIKAASMPLALEWRLHTRALFEAYLQRGYRVVEFLSDRSETERRNFYLLER